jgi:hypothetical protein
MNASDYITEDGFLVGSPTVMGKLYFEVQLGMLQQSYNERMLQQIVFINKSGCYNEHRCYNEQEEYYVR